jgi:hypothetical protein
MEKIIFNSLLKNTQKPKTWFNIISAIKEPSDYIIEYKIVFEKENGEKIKNNDFIYKSSLSSFAKKEQSYINQLIKIRSAVFTAATTVVAETTIV